MAAPVFVFAGELLHQASIYDQRDLLKSLLKAGVHGEANSQDPRGLTPLHTAALHDSVECLAELLEWEGKTFGHQCQARIGDWSGHNLFNFQLDMPQENIF